MFIISNCCRSNEHFFLPFCRVFGFEFAHFFGGAAVSLPKRRVNAIAAAVPLNLKPVQKRKCENIVADISFHCRLCACNAYIFWCIENNTCCPSPFSFVFSGTAPPALAPLPLLIHFAFLLPILMYTRPDLEEERGSPKPGQPASNNTMGEPKKTT